MKEKYFFDVEQKVEEIIKGCLSYVKNLGIPISNSIYFGTNKGCSYYGRTTFKPRTKKCLGYDYYVTVNKFLTNEKDIIETVIHDLLHTVKGCMNHGSTWNKHVQTVNKDGKYKITFIGKATLDREAYKNKHGFPLKYFDPLTMDIVYCPKCGNKFCLNKKVEKTATGRCKYLCQKCKVRLKYL